MYLRSHKTFGRHRNPSSPNNEICSPRPTPGDFRLAITRPNTLLALLFKKPNSSLPLSNLHISTLEYHIRYATHACKIDLQTDPLPDMTSQPPKNCERAFRNMIRNFINGLWKGQLYNAARTHAGQPPGRKASYIQVAHDDLQRLDLFKPAQSLRTPEPAPNSLTSKPSHQLHPYQPPS